MRKGVVIILLIGVLAAGAFAAGRILVASASSGMVSESAPAPRLLYLYYAGTYLTIDQEGVVCVNSSDEPSGIPRMTGVEFLNLTYGKKAEPEETGALEYVMKVAMCLEKHGISADQICYDGRMVDVMIGRLRICLGKNEKTEEKISDLSNFIDKLEGASGTLYMQNGNANNYGYTFRANKS